MRLCLDCLSNFKNPAHTDINNILSPDFIEKVKCLFNEAVSYKMYYLLIIK